MTVGSDNDDASNSGDLNRDVVPTAHPGGDSPIDVEPMEGLLTTEDEFGDVEIPGNEFPGPDASTVEDSCPACGLPNPTGRERCRSCGERM